MELIFRYEKTTFCDEINIDYLNFFITDIIAKMHEERDGRGEGGYMWRDTDEEYSKEVEAAAAETNRRTSRPVASITPMVDVVPNSNPNSSSDSDEPPPLEDIVERPTLQQQYADFFERRRQLLIGDAHANNDEGNQGNGDDGSDQDVFA